MMLTLSVILLLIGSTIINAVVLFFSNLSYLFKMFSPKKLTRLKKVYPYYTIAGCLLVLIGFCGTYIFGKYSKDGKLIELIVLLPLVVNLLLINFYSKRNTPIIFKLVIPVMLIIGGYFATIISYNTNNYEADQEIASKSYDKTNKKAERQNKEIDKENKHSLYQQKLSPYEQVYAGKSEYDKRNIDFAKSLIDKKLSPISTLQSINGKKIKYDNTTINVYAVLQKNQYNKKTVAAINQAVKDHPDINFYQIYPMNSKKDIQSLYNDAQSTYVFDNSQNDKSLPLVNEAKIKYAPTIVIVDGSGHVRMTDVGVLDDNKLDQLINLAKNS